MVSPRRHAAVLASARAAEAQATCTVMGCHELAERADDASPAPFCLNHWHYLKPWQHRSLREAFDERRWDDYFTVVRLCADHLEGEIARAREAGFQGIRLARYFSDDNPRGRVVRYFERKVA